MPWKLYSYIVREVLKVLILSTTVLVVVISFAVAIKPLADGLLSAQGMVKFVFYSMPTVIGLALPFAAAFASTLVFCRLANDNEILACRASGMSYWEVLLPMLVLGLVLTGGIYFLTNWVVPKFYMLAQQQVESDMVSMLVRQVQKRQTLQPGKGIILYADSADETQPLPQPQPKRFEVSPGNRVRLDAFLAQRFELNDLQINRLVLSRGLVRVNQKLESRGEVELEPGAVVDIDPFDNPNDLVATKRLVLQGVAVAKQDKDGGIKREGTAETANVLMLRDRKDGKTYVAMRLHNAMIYDAESKQFAYSQISDIQPLPLDNPFRDRLAFLSLGDLLSLGRDPEKFDLVRERKETLVDALSVERLLRKIESRLQSGALLTLSAPGSGQSFTLSAPSVQRVHKKLKLEQRGGAQVRAVTQLDGLPERIIEATTGELEIELGDLDDQASARIELGHATIQDAKSGRKMDRKRLQLDRGRWPDGSLENLVSKPSRELLMLSRASYATSEEVQKAADGLETARAKLGRKIIAKLHERAASATGCLLVLLLGAVLSMQMRGHLPLMIYFWSFLLAAIAIIIAHSGEDIASRSSGGPYFGYFVIWAGDILLLVAISAVYLRLSRN